MEKMGVSIDVGLDGVAVIRIRNPPVNALAPLIIAGLKEKYIEAMERVDVKAIVVTGEAGKFSSGFDINTLQNVQKIGDVSLLPDVSIELMVNNIEDAKKPSVAAIQGVALGGGLELAMACHARIATPEVQLGLPELTLGVIPGFGGTQRLPRLVGISKAIDMMLSSKSIIAKEGKELGLIDAIVSSEDLLRVSRLWAIQIAERRKPRISSLRRTDKLSSLSEVHEILTISREYARKAAPNMPQYLACLNVIGEGISLGGYAGVLKEEKLFKELVLSSTSKGLVRVFFARRATSRSIPSSESQWARL
ncbi:peroxisomal fatty acid beta-oxidation multifunctional protein-like [Magnolia sinica]|uniref:peroxisomal fatty acid beta-oxidation multifunctional protein-like n=1 Tax=Magnolia sinica TaxID=86752 RepID=UPI002659AB34|nr:peroxisomal fatty acid beta-oxidation multifunctional protein-like [Magnolia sinica]